MKMEKLTYEITMRAGDYQSIKIGGEWSVDHKPTPADIATLDSELRQQIEVVLQQRKADAEDKRKAQAEQPKAEQVQPKSEQVQPKSEQAQPKADAEDKRELVTTSKKDEARLKAILKKIQDGIPEETVRKFFRFDDKAEMLVKIALQDIMHS